MSVYTPGLVELFVGALSGMFSYAVVWFLLRPTSRFVKEFALHTALLLFCMLYVVLIPLLREDFTPQQAGLVGIGYSLIIVIFSLLRLGHYARTRFLVQEVYMVLEGPCEEKESVVGGLIQKYQIVFTQRERMDLDVPYEFRRINTFRTLEKAKKFLASCVEDINITVFSIEVSSPFVSWKSQKTKAVGVFALKNLIDTEQRKVGYLTRKEALNILSTEPR